MSCSSSLPAPSQHLPHTLPPAAPPLGPLNPHPHRPYTLYIRTLDPVSIPSARPPTTTAIRRTPYRIRGGGFRAHTFPNRLQRPVAPTRHPPPRHRAGPPPHQPPAARRSRGAALRRLHPRLRHRRREAVVPSLSGLSPAARACVRGLQLTKRALPFVSGFDRAEWGAAYVFFGGGAAARGSGA